jgi:hypothetical protein
MSQHAPHCLIVLRHVIYLCVKLESSLMSLQQSFRMLDIANSIIKRELAYVNELLLPI